MEECGVSYTVPAGIRGRTCRLRMSRYRCRSGQQCRTIFLLKANGCCIAHQTNHVQASRNEGLVSIVFYVTPAFLLAFRCTTVSIVIDDIEVRTQRQRATVDRDTVGCIYIPRHSHSIPLVVLRVEC